LVEGGDDGGVVGLAGLGRDLFEQLTCGVRLGAAVVDRVGGAPVGRGQAQRGGLVERQGEGCGAEVDTVIKRSEFGMNYALGMVGDDIGLTFQVTAFRVPPDGEADPP